MKPQGLTYSQLFLSPEGRIPLSTFWLHGYLPLFVIGLLVTGLDFLLGTINEEIGIGIFGGIFYVLALYPWISLFLKRIHDRGRTGWFLFLIFIPLVNLWLMVEIYFLKGTDGENQYGPDPLG